jgi:DNA mismatch repair protein MutS2
MTGRTGFAAAQRHSELRTQNSSFTRKAHHDAMRFAVGDPVHVASLGKGTIREVRNGDRYLVELKGHSLVVTSGQLTRQELPRKAARAKPVRTARSPDDYAPAGGPAVSIDLHGKTVDEALEAVNDFLNRAFLTGSAEARIIHGRSGGKLKAAVHAHLRRLPSVRRFGLDPRNAGVTVVTL